MSDPSSTDLTALTSGWKVGPSVPPADLDEARNVLAASIAQGKSAAELNLSSAVDRVGTTPAPPAETPGPAALKSTVVKPIEANPVVTHVGTTAETPIVAKPIVTPIVATPIVTTPIVKTPIITTPIVTTPVVGTPVTPAQPAPQPLGFTQSRLNVTVENPLGVPAWANGMAQGKKLGPFVDETGLKNVVVTIPLTQSKTFTIGTAANGFAVLPVSGAPAAATSVTLGAGSVWFASTLLVGGAPAGSFCGFLISGGTLTSSVAFTLQAGAYVIPPGATLTLQAAIAQPASGAGGTPGADLTSASISLPPTVTIQFTQTAATIEALGDANLKLYGTSLGMTWPQRTAQLVPDSQAILIPAKSSVTSFGFESVHSTLFVPSGSAAIVTAGWALPIATTPIASLGEAAGAGSLLLELGAGAAFTCGVRGAVNASGWFVSADPSKLFVLVGGKGAASEARYTLWPALPPAKLASSFAWSNPAAAAVSFLATPGHETLLAEGVANVFIDRPRAADGRAFPISGAGLIAQIAEATGTHTFVLGRAAVPPTTTLEAYIAPPTFAIALENALIGVRAPSLFFIEGPTTGTTFASADVTLLYQSLWLLPTLPDPYAANFDVPALLREEADRGAGALAVTVAWSGTGLAFGFLLEGGIGDSILAPAQVPGAVVAADTASAATLTLLDLSTRVDLFGVTVSNAALDVQTTSVLAFAATPGTFGFVGLALALPTARVATFALPQVSWEPMLSTG
ncbi:MAG: hypothetical protein IAI49_13950, partial [Candidatus Eremiobacteraeota bacterium]|nr:hypothetical protein [Candidatus Eremiobacteraeota bacterium]